MECDRHHPRTGGDHHGEVGGNRGRPLAAATSGARTASSSRDAGISNTTQVLVGLIEAGEFTQILQRVDECPESLVFDELLLDQQ